MNQNDWSGYFNHNVNRGDCWNQTPFMFNNWGQYPFHPWNYMPYNTPTQFGPSWHRARCRRG